MRTLIIAEPNIPPPPEQMPFLMDAMRDWRDRWRSKMEMFEFFAEGGGWGVFNADDETELSQVVMEFPMGPFSNVQVRPTVDGDDALKRLTDTVQQFAAAMGSSG